MLGQLITIGTAAGFLSGLLGVGGGSIIVPAMVYFLSTEMHLAIGTSLVVIIPTAVAGALTHLRNGTVDLRLAGVMIVGGVVGSLLGANAARFLPAALLKKGFALFLMFTSAKMLLGK